MSEIERKPFMRRIRSFVRREGRLTKGQLRALEVLFPQFGIEQSDHQIDLKATFGREANTVLEIGFGNGASLAEMAKANPQNNYIGIEVHRPGVGNLLIQIEQDNIKNIRVICADAVEVLEQMIPNESLARVQLFFPDPWHKKKHHKRRIVQQAFIELLRKKLIIGGVFHMATDWQHYAEHMMVEMSAAVGFVNQSDKGEYAPRPDYRPLTKFEQRGHRLGHGVWDLLFERIA